MWADVTHFSMVGFVYEGEANTGIGQLVQAQIKTCTPKPLGPDDLSCEVRDPSGAELRISLRKHPDGRAELITLNPAFAGESRVKAHIVADNSDPEWAPFEVGRAARFAGEQTPFMFELADPAQAATINPGSDLTLSISAFSYAPELFKDAKSFLDAQRKGGAKVALAPEFFIPSGMMFEKVGGALPDGAKRPTPYADFAGTVLKATLVKNAAGGASFWSVLARTYAGATVDVVIDPATIRVEPRPGYIVTGRFWMSGRIAPAA
jgi:hypothetical protein